MTQGPDADTTMTFSGGGALALSAVDDSTPEEGGPLSIDDSTTEEEKGKQSDSVPRMPTQKPRSSVRSATASRPASFGAASGSRNAELRSTKGATNSIKMFKRSRTKKFTGPHQTESQTISRISSCEASSARGSGYCAFCMYAWSWSLYCNT